ncbi:MAG: sulfatase-like hydrolase/transferase [Thermoanaerobaculia bacterium]|nr:sulfatase-like hydrolase/transferase [Thermoanaerobaculia bacterium]
MLFLSVLWLYLCSAGCGPAPGWNVVIVSFDTTRADRIACYGNEQIRTPAVDGLAADGVLFENAYSPIPITLPSHSSLMTGKVPFAHGVRDNGLFHLGEEQITLAEILRDLGYRTAAAVGAYPLLASTGIAQGFEFFDDHLTTAYEDFYGDRIFPKERLFFDERRASRVNEAILPWLEEYHREPFFLWVHYFDPHLPHEPPAPFDQLYAHELYDGEIAYADESLGTLLNHLKRLGVYDRTLIVFTSDHGEGRGEHDESTHSMLVYNTTLHVPLVMKLPAGSDPARNVGSRIGPGVSIVDVLPTVLDVLGAPIPDGIQGRSLDPLLRGEADRGRQQEIYAETLSPRITRNWGEQRALLLNEFKYIHGPRRELYDLTEDPREIDNLVDLKPDVADGMEQRLAEYLLEHSVAGLDASVDVDQETARRLQALGYLQVSGDRFGPIDEMLSREGAAPQDHVRNVADYSQAKALLFQGRFGEGKELVLGLLERDPENPHYLEMLANVETRLGHHEAALEIYEKLELVTTGYPPLEQVLEAAGRVLLARGEIDEALGKLRRAQSIETTADGQYRLAKVYERLGRSDDELLHLHRALEIDQGFVPARIDVGIRHAVAGELDLAESHLKRAVSDDPYYERGFFNYGAFLIQIDQPRRALRYFQRAVDLRSTYVEALYALVETHARLAEPEAAEAALRSLEDVAPESRVARAARQLLDASP